MFNSWEISLLSISGSFCLIRWISLVHNLNVVGWIHFTPTLKNIFFNTYPRNERNIKENPTITDIKGSVICPSPPNIGQVQKDHNHK